MSGTRHWLDNLKLRASWGKLGNDGGDDVSEYEYQSVYGITDYSFGGKQVSGLAMTGLANAALGWERSTTTDIGIDVGALKNRLSLEVDYYYQKDNRYFVSSCYSYYNGWADCSSYEYC